MPAAPITEAGASMNNNVTLSPAELDRLAESIADRLANRPRLVDRVELARTLGLSVPTIERYTRSGKIACVRIGRRVLYAPDAVIESLSVAAVADGGDA